MPAARLGIRRLLDQLDALSPIREQLEADIQALADKLPAYLLTLPGSSPLAAVSLFGETDPIQAFGSAAQLVAFAGLDPVFWQSGGSATPNRHISKRGSPYLRKTLWTMTFRAIQHEGDLRDYWLRKRRQGAHHLVAVTAAAVKLCHFAWRIMVDQRDYLPQRPVSKP